VQDGVEAEGIGFRRVFLSERWNLKEAGAILGGVGALTEHIGLATGVMPPHTARHPLHAAALASTMNTAYGSRFILGLGRGDGGAIGEKTGLRTFGYQATEDYVDIIRRLWRGEAVDYDGPAGEFGGLKMDDRHDGPDPEIWLGSFGMSRGAKTAALCADVTFQCPHEKVGYEGGMGRNFVRVQRVRIIEMTGQRSECEGGGPTVGEKEVKSAQRDPPRSAAVG
jgi:alkanesulfonate monooxygenase SsuD/methylene tetrahydromethanopterin reductase-like flavin-dependent oxidoreductase (luciferase family)